jgi:hypothetical protein
MEDVERVLRLTAWFTASVAATVTTIKNLGEMKDRKKEKKKKRRSPSKKKRRK